MNFQARPPSSDFALKDNPRRWEHRVGAGSYAGLQSGNDGETSIFNVGKYIDRFAMADDIAKLAIRTCNCDTHRFATLLPTPIL